MRISISIGEYATTPYYMAGLEIPVYCMEELCYCIRENAFLLDAGLMNEALVDWIGEKCGLKELAKLLYPLVRRQGTLSAFVTAIFEYVGLYDAAAVRETVEVLIRGAGLSSIEKRKSQVDYLVGKKKYMSAVRGYDALLSKWEDTAGVQGELPAAGVRAAILHNKGVAFTGMMYYEQAAECFKQAYEMDGMEEHYTAYLAAKRIGLEEEEYIAFATELSDSYESTLRLERTMEQLGRSWEEQADYQRLAARIFWRTGKEKQKYYNENDRLIQAMKESYRDCVQDDKNF